MVMKLEIMYAADCLNLTMGESKKQKEFWKNCRTEKQREDGEKQKWKFTKI